MNYGLCFFAVDRSKMGKAILSQPACVSKLLSLLLDQRSVSCGRCTRHVLSLPSLSLPPLPPPTHTHTTHTVWFDEVLHKIWEWEKHEYNTVVIFEVLFTQTYTYAQIHMHTHTHTHTHTWTHAQTYSHSNIHTPTHIAHRLSPASLFLLWKVHWPGHSCRNHCGGDSEALGIVSLFPHHLGSRSPPVPLRRQLSLKEL